MIPGEVLCDRETYLKKHSRIRAATLLTTLMLIGLGLVLVLVLSSASLSQLHRNEGMAHSMKATRAAESVVVLATEKLVNDPGFLTGSSNFLDWQDDSSRGRLSFDQAQANAWGIPVSINNREGASAIDGWQGIRVPAKSVHLVAVGESAGRRKTIDVVVSVPEFPFAVASSGPIESEGGLLVGGFLGEDVSELKLDSLGPADLFSNDPGESIKLNGKVSVTGDVSAVGKVILGTDVEIHGAVKQSSDPISLAKIDVSTMRLKHSAPLVPKLGHNKIDESMHFNAPELNLTQGLELDDGLLYVNGDLKIKGGVRGHGALLVNGSVEIEGGATLSAQNQVAIVAEGDVIVHGSGDGSLFQGLIYTEGDLVAEDITLLGAFVANRDGGTLNPGSRLKMKNAKVVHKPGFSSFETTAREVRFSLSGGTAESGFFRDQYEISLNVTEAEWEQFQKWVEDMDAMPQELWSGAKLILSRPSQGTK